jgi:hypothetical protein
MNSLGVESSFKLGPRGLTGEPGAAAASGEHGNDNQRIWRADTVGYFFPDLDPGGSAEAGAIGKICEMRDILVSWERSCTRPSSVLIPISVNPAIVVRFTVDLIHTISKHIIQNVEVVLGRSQPARTRANSERVDSN